MKTYLKLLVLAVVLALAPASFASEHPDVVMPSEIACYGTTTFSKTLYLGYDTKVHYFFWRKGLQTGMWKVPRFYLDLPGDFPTGKGKAFVKHNANAELVLFGFKPASR